MEWISIKKKKPKQNWSVLVFCNAPNTKEDIREVNDFIRQENIQDDYIISQFFNPVIQAQYKNEIGGFVAPSFEDGDIIHLHDVTHWMPLPTPPKQ